MPLIKGKSKRAFEENIKSELGAGKPKDQALAIAYSIKRKAAQKKMAEGGPVLSGAESAQESMRKAFKFADGGLIKKIMAKRMDRGGQLPEDQDYLREWASYPDPDDKELETLDPDSEQMMADGGEVTLDPNERKTFSESFNAATKTKVNPEISDEERKKQSMKERIANWFRGDK